jgi:outer membrane protein assembly factor BamB
MRSGLRAAVVAATVAGFAACGEDDPPGGPGGSADGGFDVALVGDAGTPPPPADADPPPGNVCGDRTGLFAGSAWPLRGGCPTRAGWSALAGPQTAGTYWTAPTPVNGSSPAALGANAWVGGADGFILSVGEGRVRFAKRTGSAAVVSSPALDAKGNAVVVGSDGTLYGLADGNGAPEPDGGPFAAAKVVFSLPLGSGGSSPVIGPNGTIYVGTLAGKLVAVNATGTSILWSTTTNDTAGSSPAIGQDGTLYIGSSDRKLYAITSEGTIRWALDVASEIQASPAVGGDGTVYVGSIDGKLHAVSSAGAIRWSYATGGPIKETPAVYAGVVFVGSEDKSLHAVSVLDGEKRWTYETRGAVATPVIGPDGTVYAGSTDNHIYALTPKGTLYFAVNVRGKVRGAPAITAGGALVVPTDTGLVSVGP